MKKQALTALFLVVLAVGMASTATAETADDTENTDVNVTVSSETALDVKPDQLTYEQVAVGDRQVTTDNDHGYDSVKVENTGSNDIQRVWLNTSFPTSNPFGQGDTNAHDSANFLQVKPLGDSTNIRGNNTTYHYPQRYEYFQDNSPLVDLGDFESEYGTVDVGRIRVGNNEFYFALGYDSACDTGSELRVGQTPSTPSSIGTNYFDSSNSDAWTAHNITTTVGTNYGITNESVSLPLDGTVDGISEDETQSYDVLTKCDGLSNVAPTEPHLILTRYNVEAGNADNIESTEGSGGEGDVATEVWRSTGSGALSPGQSFEVDVAVQIPRGVPNGDITEGTLTVYSQSG